MLDGLVRACGTGRRWRAAAISTATISTAAAVAAAATIATAVTAAIATAVTAAIAAAVPTTIAAAAGAQDANTDQASNRQCCASEPGRATQCRQ